MKLCYKIFRKKKMKLKKIKKCLKKFKNKIKFSKTN